MTYTLGSPVRFTHILTREDVHCPEKTGAEVNQKHWLPSPKEGRGILVGFRTKSNGFVETVRDGDDYWGGDYYTIWTPVNYVKCAIVSTNLYRNTIFVPLDALKEETND